MKRTLTLAALFLLALLALPVAGQEQTCPDLVPGDAESYLEWAACETLPAPRAGARSEGFGIAAASKIPGVGLVVHEDRVVGAQLPPGCPRSWKLAPSRNPWVVLGIDLQSLPLRDLAFVGLYTEWIGGGRYSSAPHADGSARPCWVGGFAGDDPHLSTGRSFLPALCAAGPIQGVVNGSAATHDCRPLRWELLALQAAGVYSDRVAPAYAKLIAGGGGGGGGGGDPVPPKPPEAQCSEGWNDCTPLPPGKLAERTAQGWRIIKTQPKRPLDCWQESKAFGYTLYYVPSARCLGTGDTEPPVEPEPPVDPPVEPEPEPDPPIEPDLPTAPCDLTTIELELGLLRAELQSLRSTLEDVRSRVMQLESQHREMERRAQARHEGRTP